MSNEHFDVLTPLSDAAIARGADVYAHYTNADPTSQYIVAVEECGELVQAISKMRRVAHDPVKVARAKESLSEEMADMRIMLAQLTVMLDIDEDVAHQTERKLERQRNRIKGTIAAVSGY